jgi:hypothetical protein
VCTQKVGIYDPSNIFTGIDQIYNTVSFEDEQDISGVDCILTSRLTPRIRDYISNGGKALFVQRGSGAIPYKKVSFWREGMVRCFDHPVLEGIRSSTFWMI